MKPVIKRATPTTLALDPSRGIATVVDEGEPSVFVSDPVQAAGSAQPTRIITRPATRIGNPSAVTWTGDGSLWVVDLDLGGVAGVELLRYGPGADGDVAPDRVISGDGTGLDSLAVVDARIVSGQAAAVRLLEFARLPTGRLKVRIVATNAAGPGPAATQVFQK